ncbi:hypothetical protein ABZV77_12775 [Streptomyces sp. NPDC004732]|uniref:hypothetical protein n=1 Tax=Streptomyces sp. NPDC004732 TaxID=3154290 RepID=UPI0033BF87F8
MLRIHVVGEDQGDGCGNTYWHHVHGFTTLDGQYIEFEEDAVVLVQGYPVTVRYRPSNPYG